MSAIKSIQVDILNLPNNKIPLTHHSLIFTVSHHDCLCPCSSLSRMCFSLTLPFRLFHACLLYSLFPLQHPPSPCRSLSLSIFAFPISFTMLRTLKHSYCAHILCSPPGSRCAAHGGGIVGILTWSAFFKLNCPAAARRASHTSTAPTMIIVFLGG